MEGSVDTHAIYAEDDLQVDTTVPETMEQDDPLIDPLDTTDNDIHEIGLDENEDLEGTHPDG